MVLDIVLTYPDSSVPVVSSFSMLRIGVCDSARQAELHEQFKLIMRHVWLFEFTHWNRSNSLENDMVVSSKDGTLSNAMRPHLRKMIELEQLLCFYIHSADSKPAMLLWIIFLSLQNDLGGQFMISNTRWWCPESYWMFSRWTRTSDDSQSVYPSRRLRKNGYSIIPRGYLCAGSIVSSEVTFINPPNESIKQYTLRLLFWRSNDCAASPTNDLLTPNEEGTLLSVISQWLTDSVSGDSSCKSFILN